MAEMWISMGPQHPMTHGLWTLKVKVDGETVVDTEPDLGYIHRAVEKIAELRDFTKFTTYCDRLCYASANTWSHSYIYAAENLLEVEVPERAEYIRVMFDEITRIMNHLMWIGTHALDVGAMSVFLYAFREREALIDCYEAVSGSRMHATYYRPGGVYRDLPDKMPQYLESKLRSKEKLEEINENRQGSLLDFIDDFAKNFPKSIQQYSDLLTDNRIFKQRNVDIGVVTKQEALDHSFSGVMLRGSGIAWDLRKAQPYECYQDFDFKIPVGKNGDCYDRYLCRMEEMRESVKIIKDCIKKMPTGPVKTIDGKITPPKKEELKNSMEALIHHFKLFSEGFRVPEGEIYAPVEAPKGEFGVYLISDGSNKPYKCKIRAPGFSHLQSMDYLLKGHMLADIPAVLGSLDIVFGEVDR